MTTAIERIAVIGATGTLGQPVARQLAAAGFRVTIASRDRARAKSLFPTLDVASADVFDLPSLVDLFSSNDAVYLNLAIDYGRGKEGPHAETDGLRNVIDAAVASDLKRIALISSLVKNYEGMNGFHWWAFEIKHQAVRMLRSAPVDWTIFHPSSFMENFTASQREGNRIMLAGRSRHPMWFIAGDDYGKQVARAFRLPEAARRELPVQGLEPYTYEEAARLFVENYHAEPLEISKTPFIVLKLAGLFKPQLRNVSKIVQALNEYPEQFESEETWKLLGKPEITLAEFARRESERAQRAKE